MYICAAGMTFPGSSRAPKSSPTATIKQGPISRSITNREIAKSKQNINQIKENNAENQHHDRYFRPKENEAKVDQEQIIQNGQESLHEEEFNPRF